MLVDTGVCLIWRSQITLPVSVQGLVCRDPASAPWRLTAESSWTSPPTPATLCRRASVCRGQRADSW